MITDTESSIRGICESDRKENKDHRVQFSKVLRTEATHAYFLCIFSSITKAKVMHCG